VFKQTTTVTNRSSKGFTFLELVLALSVIALITTLGVLSFNKSTQSITLDTVSDKTQATLELAKQFATSLHKPIGVSLNAQAIKITTLTVFDFTESTPSQSILYTIELDDSIHITPNPVIDLIRFSPTTSVRAFLDGSELVATAAYQLKLVNNDNASVNVLIYHHSGSIHKQ